MKILRGQITYFAVFLTVLPAHSRLLPHAKLRNSPMKTFFHHSLRPRGPYEPPGTSDDLRRSDQTPIYLIIIKSKPEKMPYERLFDENGMIYLTKPTNDGDRKLNSDINKLVERNVKLRSGSATKLAKNNERMDDVMRQLEKDKDTNNGLSMPKTVYEFSELVL